MIRLSHLLALTLIALPAVPALAEEKATDTYRQLNLFGDVFERVRADYVEEVTDKKLIEAAINGMLTHLDPHSGYLDADNFKDMQVQTKGEFGGLGIEVTMENGFVKVVSPIDDTPAARAGIKPGDFITHLDGKPVLGLTLSEAVDKMRGPVKTDIKLTIRRDGTPEPFDVVLTRDTIRIRSVRWREEGDIGYIRVTTFNEQTDTLLSTALKELNEKIGKDKLKGFVLDMRNNPGGLLEQAVSVSDAFLEKGEIVSTRGRRVEETQRFNARQGDAADGKPIVVLINGGSASASEIVAGALQDHNRAVIMGTQSFGKGSVQTVIPLAGHGAMRLTTARYYTPSGNSIQAKGITPDIIVPASRVERLNEPAGRREADLPGALNNTQPTPDDKKAAADAAEKDVEDYQLARALDVLTGIALYKKQNAAP